MEETMQEIKERWLLIEKEFKTLNNNIKQGLKLDLLNFEKWNSNDVWQWIKTIKHSQTKQPIFNTNHYSFVFKKKQTHTHTHTHTNDVLF